MVNNFHEERKISGFDMRLDVNFTTHVLALGWTYENVRFNVLGIGWMEKPIQKR